jgi:hypothetical protein
MVIYWIKESTITLFNQNLSGFLEKDFLYLIQLRNFDFKTITQSSPL